MPFDHTARLAGAALALALGTTPALAIDVTRSVDVAAPPAKVWAAMGSDFCGLGTWHPAIAKCELTQKDGSAMRTLTLKGDNVPPIVERQVARDEAAMSESYVIVEPGPLPVQDYESTLTVTPKGDGSTVTWTGRFAAKGADDATATGAIEGVYQDGLDALKAGVE